MKEDDQNSRAKDLVKAGAEIVGASALAAVGTFFVSPGVAAALLSRLTGTLIDQAERMLSRREQVRIGAAAAIAADDLRRRIESGEQLPSKEFFEPSQGTRSAAEEIFEGALQKARTQHEELKVPYLGHLFASITLDPAVSRGEANRLLDLVDRLTYRKLCLLALL